MQKVNMSCEEFLMKLKVLISLVTLVVFASPVIAQDRLVPLQYNDIQSAIDAAVNGDEVVVSDGTWTGVGNRGLDFGGKAITVRSENGPANCIIDCGGLGQAFYFHSGETSSSVVQGFTIKNGLAYFGGAIECILNSSPTIRDCIFTGNRADYYGGAIECYEASPEIFNCLFYDNSAGDYGGAIDCEDASP